MQTSIRRPPRQDTFDLRDQIHPDDHTHLQDATYHSDEEHSVLEDDSDGDEREEYVDEDDGSSTLSIPNESIDFDLVYAFHSFAATVEGQANVVKGDSLFLMDDTNSYWWLVRVLKTQEVGYIPAENIETPFERLARLNKHRNIDLASATQAELRERDDHHGSHERLQANTARVTKTPSPVASDDVARAADSAGQSTKRSVAFTPAFSVHRYPPAVWNSDDEDDDDDTEWDIEGYEDVDPALAEERARMHIQMNIMEPDDGMSWEDGAVEEIQARERQALAANGLPASLRPGLTSGQRSQQAQPSQTLSEPQDIMEQALRSSPSREPNAVDNSARLDPTAAMETRKITVTPSVARDPMLAADDQSRQPQPFQVVPTGPLLPSAIMQQQQEERKRTREEIEALEESSRKKTKSRDGASPDPKSGSKLRKERDNEEDTGKEKDKKSKGGLFSGIFGRKKDKSKDRNVSGSGSLDSSSDLRMSEESSQSGHQAQDGRVTSPIPSNPRQQQQQQQTTSNSTDPKRAPQQSSSRGPQEQISQHASQLRQYDQQQQQLFQQYLNRSPSSPPEPSYGLTSAPLMPYSISYASSTSSNSNLTPGTSRPRPGSLILSPTAMEGQAVGVPDLSVIRIFAGKHLQTEATFKTVLLNSSTSASDLVRQAIQRFRLPAAEDVSSYYLTMKQVQGSSAVLRPEEKPLGVFESLVEAALELPKVKRSSVGSISSIASNLSMHPAIKKLSMDFSDDSAVKFYLNRKREQDDEDSSDELNGDDTLLADTSQASDNSAQYLSVSSSIGIATQERFSSPSFRFALQLVIYPDDLPDDMLFDTRTEAIIFKHTVKDRPQSDASTASGVSLTQRKKIFVLPKNITVAEVIEIGLERFGISDGVVDGGDEVEDKSIKRRSSSRVRYTLHVDIGGKDRELPPSSRVIEAYTRPPAYRSIDRSFLDRKRRSIDSAQLLGTSEDLSPDDPVFILRRAVAYRQSTSRRHSAPLDEIALQQLHRSSTSSTASDSTIQSEDARRQMSKQEIIAAQRAATRANQQRAILSAQSNSSRGVDVLLPDNAVIRSHRLAMDDKIRYSYVEPDGEAYDVSDIVEEEFRGERPREVADSRMDLLQSVVRGKEVNSEKLDRVLNKIKGGKGSGNLPASSSSASTIDNNIGHKRSSSPSLYSTAEEGSTRIGSPSSGSRSGTPVASAINPKSGLSRVSSPLSRVSNSRSTTPKNTHDRQNSIASILSDMPGHRSNTPTTPPVAVTSRAASVIKRPRPFIPKDDFGLSHMLALIELGASQRAPTPQPTDLVEELFFGKSLDVESLHPQVREIYADTFKQLREMDKILDDLLSSTIHS